jgi:hypothetical protein
MPLPTTVKLMELADAKIAKMTADSGTSPTYETAIDLPGIVKVGVAPKAEIKKLYGDSKLLDIYQKTTEVELDVECAELSLEALKVLMGGSVTTSGTTPEQTATYSLTAADSTPPYFKLEGQWLYAGDGVGDVHIVLYKCKVTDPPQVEVNDVSGNFGTVKFKAIALPADSNDKWFDIVVNETKKDIQ